MSAVQAHPLPLVLDAPAARPSGVVASNGATPPDVAALFGEGVRAVAPWERRGEIDALRAAHFLTVEIEPPPPCSRGRLAERIDDAIEAALGEARAGTPGLATSREPDASLADQLFRARRSGRAGIALVIGTLAGIAGEELLHADDERSLRHLFEATRARPLRIVIADEDLPTSRRPSLASLFAPAAPRLATPPLATPAMDAPAPVPAPEPEPDVDTYVDAPVAPIAMTPHAPLVAPRIAPRVAPLPPPVPLAFPAPARPAMPPVDESWRAQVVALAAARGPQPLSAFEKTFTQSYVPLLARVAAGLDDPRAQRATQEFRHAFSRAYAEAFPTFAWTGKRPRMVLDAPQLAMRVAREHGARATQLLLVDAMRWDLGVLAFETMVRALDGRAHVAAVPHVLYAALPTTTPRQLETLTRGEAALREAPSLANDDETPPARRRGTECFRRVRIAGRAYDKLDRIEAHLAELGREPARVPDGRAQRELEDLGRSTGAVLAEYVSTLPTKTLAFVFGDHGFSFAPSGVPQQGGSSPEEVLVPAFAFVLP